MLKKNKKVNYLTQKVFHIKKKYIFASTLTFS